MKTFRYFLLLISLVTISSVACQRASSTESNPTHYADEVSYSEYSGKCVKHIYHHNERRHTVSIVFADGSVLDVIANKYVLNVRKR